MGEEQTVNIEVNVNEVNVILTALAKLPFEQVADLISKVRNQAISQLPPPTPPAV